jgi:hypothetical protein
MCIIIANKMKKAITREVFDTCWDNNPDGFGMCYSENKKLFIFKELIEDDKAYQMYLDARKTAQGTVLLHFRIATSGLVDLANCHPFHVSNDLAVCHNGIISINHAIHESDTNCFTKRVLRNLPKGFLKVESIRSLLSMSIGSSRLAFLDNLGNCTIINSNLGVNKDGNWYSNDTYKPMPIFDTGFDWKTYSQEKYKNGGENAGMREFEECQFCGKPAESLQEGCWLCDSCSQYFLAQDRSPKEYDI